MTSATPADRLDADLIVFAKAPLPGLAKTRLIPALGADGAAALAARLLEHAVAAGVRAGFAAVELCVTPNSRHPAFVALATRHPIELADQGDGDLGERMQHALARRLAHADRVVLIGTDAPALDERMLRAAAKSLARHDAVFVPAFDGGYALVGLSRRAPELFSGIGWSTARVMAESRERASAAGLSWIEMDPVADIDEADDLVHLPVGWCAAR